MAGKILLVSRADATTGPLALVLLRELVAHSGLEGRVRLDTAGVPDELGERVPRSLVRQVRNVLGLHPSLSLRRHRPKEVTERLLRRQDLVVTLDEASHERVTEVAEQIHPVMRPTVKRIEEYPLWEVEAAPEEDAWLPLIEAMGRSLESIFRIVVTDSGL